MRNTGNMEWTKEYRSEYNKAYYQANRERLRAYRKKYHYEHRFEKSEYNRKYRLARKNAEKTENDENYQKPQNCVLSHDNHSDLTTTHRNNKNASEGLKNAK